MESHKREVGGAREGVAGSRGVPWVVSRAMVDQKWLWSVMGPEELPVATSTPSSIVVCITSSHSTDTHTQ